MNHYQLETDIQHLEQVLTHVCANDRIPLSLSYWRKRVESVTSAASVPSQRSRVKKLNEALLALEARAQP
ncbi:hypothetical protein [Paraburkholderia sp. SOS3]|jgi:hypothetical protein|uniref:hypothetical protein n=1 Tax=Paraburkholderia sp. SOS3 TaxID=1926494 RepID=UPI0009475D26|nr:hypothetical protein [Paraburkholderia sp. SOS3]APR36315.1 hypothetical protein BTO02_13840 [Paraburkholderia sp. SOS3]